MNDNRDVDKMKENILKNYPRMDLDDKFQFACHKELECFNKCCADVTIALTPYDVLRMRKALGLSSDDFLAKYTLVPFTEEQRVPVVVLKMMDDEGKTCPFVTEEGCSIYADRPWACRMYPVGLASPAKENADEEEFYFIMQDRPCDGLNESKSWTISEWIADQEIDEYNKMGEYFKEVSLHPRLLGGMELTPSRMDMYYMACYKLDKFREFIFESSFLEKFDIEREVLEAIKEDDIELMKFAYRWLKFSLFGEQVIKLHPKITELVEKSKQQKNN